MTTFVDKTLTCRDCGREFIFTAGEQEFYAQRGLMNEPKRCYDCRQARRGSDGASGSGGRPQREMHEVICSNCGRTAYVPFVPTGSRPVYCADCFASMRGR
jgi:CxxC-x17-CxxC domain-containing protein